MNDRDENEKEEKNLRDTIDELIKRAIRKQNLSSSYGKGTRAMKRSNRQSKDTAKDVRLKCSFCGKATEQVKKLISGPGVYICNECVDLCNEILDEELGASERAGELERLGEAGIELMRIAMERSNCWIIERRIEATSGVHIMIAGETLGSSLEERVLYASAFDDLVKTGSLTKCGDFAYQLSWQGVMEVRTAQKTDAGAAIEHQDGQEKGTD